MNPEHQYGLYSGDKFVDVGTAEELAKKMGVSRDYVRYLSTPRHQRKLARTKKPTGRAKYTVKLGPVEEDYEQPDVD